MGRVQEVVLCKEILMMANFLLFAWAAPALAEPLISVTIADGNNYFPGKYV